MQHLSRSQKLIYDMEKYSGGAISVICGSMLLRGERSADDMQMAANELRRINSALRTRIVETDAGTMQVVEEYAPQDVKVLRFSSKLELTTYAEAYAQEPLPLYSQLCEFTVVLLPGQSGLLVKLHHIIGDAWTLALLGTQCNAILNGKTPLAYPYDDHLQSEDAYLQSERCDKDRAYFLQQFKKCGEVTYLSEKQNSSVSARRKTFIIDKEKTKQLVNYAKSRKASVFTLFLTIVAAYFSRVTQNVEKFYIGTAVLNRAGAREKNTAGMFINMIPLLMELENAQSFSYNLEAVKATAFAAFRHQKFNYDDILTAIRREYGSSERLYDVMFSYQNATITGGDGGMESAWYHCGAQTESLQIHIDDRDNEGILCVHFDYQTEKFTEREIERMYDHMLDLLFEAIKHDRKKLTELELLTSKEKQQLLYDFNDTAEDYPRDKCVHTLFEEQAARTPDKTAVVACDQILTYRELNEQANRIAHGLIAHGVKPGDIVAFMLPRRSYLIAAIFGVLKAGAAYLPIDPDYPRERIDYMLEDSKATYFITEANIQELLANGNVTAPMITMVSDSLCYCIYTSGSTGKPKGALLLHKNAGNYVSSNSYNVVHSVIQDDCKTIVSLATVGFDMFTTESLLSTINGMTILLANESQAKIQAELNEFLMQNPADVMQTTPTKMRVLIANPSQRDYLKSLKVILLGGEVVDSILVVELKKITTARIFNMYGPTETMVWSTRREILSADEITIGSPIANTQIYILDHYMNPVPVGVVGELCIAGDGVGAGYLNRPDLTAEKFVNNLFGEGKLYKTGDLAYWREDGNIVYVGRNDFQVKIRGLRIELGEIENAIQEVEGISQAAVVVRKNEAGRQFICAFYTGQETDAKTLRTAIGKKLPKYMLPHSVTHLVSMPLTSSGKVSRKALPEIDLNNIATTVEYIAPKTEQETALINAAQKVLHIEKIGVADNFFDLGGDSLKAIELLSALEQTGYRAEIKTIFETDTLEELAGHLTAAETNQEVKIPDGPISATDAQVRVYTAQAVAGGTAYNVPYAFQVKHLDPVRLQAAVFGLVARHESLRTRFENRDGQIMQIVEDTANCSVEALDSGDISAFVRPFDLETAPLLRVGYYQNTVMIDMHHIITDGGSMPVFLRELNELYMGRELDKRPVQYREFAVRAHDYTQSEQYWLSVYADEPPVLEMNTDHTRQNKQTFFGAALYKTLPSLLHAQICEKCKVIGITPYAFYMGAFYILLSKFSGNEDIVVGVPASGRSGKFLNSIGMFVNTLALRGKPEGDKTTMAFLREIREMTVQALDHQDYPYGELVKKLDIHTGNRNPLFDVMFAYQSEKMADVVFGDEPAELLPIPVTTSKYDITLNVLPRQEDVVLMAEYCVDLYGERTLHRLMEGYKLILTQMLDSGKQLKDISAVTDTERQQIFYAFNDTAADYPRDKCVHTLFEEQAAKTPDKTAVVACDRTLTYRELNEQANQIAHGLIDQGVKHGDIVAFALPRRSYLIAVMFGILKAGAAYLPIDPDYPQDRIDYMLEDSKAAYFVTELNIHELLANENVTDPMISMVSDSLCYCIYTSGSTGRPKGALLRHRGIVNLVTNLKMYHDLSNCKRIGFMTTITFDVATQEIFTALLNGFTGILVAERRETGTDKIISSIQESKIDVIYATPTYLDALTDSTEKAEKLLSAVKVICLAGEKFYLNCHVLSLKDRHPVIFENQYGPAEVHVITTTTIEHCSDITIGKPIANTQIYIVDKYMRPVPISVTGELCIAGDGVGAGYLNRPELTAEKFIDNPFGEGKLYKTGDLAYWRKDGNIVYVGRNDFQVKIRGLRIELGEIENAIQEVEGISQAAVVVRKNEAGHQFICAFYTGQETDAKTLRTAIGKKLPKYMLPHSFTHLVSMPLTSSGKVSRKALPEIDLKSAANVVEYIEPKTEREIALCAAVQTVLHIEKVGMEHNFFDLGGDSLKAIELIAVLEQAGYSTEVKTVFEVDTLEELAKRLTDAEAEQEAAIPAGPIPATDAQVRVYTAQTMAGGTAYNVPYAFRVEQLDPEKLQAAVSGLVARHESLRTRFENRNGQIMQIVEDSANCVVEALDSEDISAFIRPFDLEAVPLLRIGYYQNTVMVDMHHIITDGGSIPVFLKELNELYMGRELNKRPAQYREFAVRAHDYTRSEQYWLSAYADESPVLEMNTDYPRQGRQTFAGAAVYEELPGALHEQICEKCGTLGITPYAFYMGAFYILLSKFSGNEDIVVGSPASGRSGKFLNSIGMFVNTLALRGKPEGEKTVSTFLHEIREMTVQALDNQEYPYGDLVKKLGIRTENRNPLFDVMFAYQSEKMADVVFGDKPAELMPVPVTISKYDITLNVLPRQKDVVLMAEYCVDLYEEQTLRRLIDGYKLILTQMLDSGRQLKDISAVTDTERQHLLYEFNDTAADYPRDKCVHTLFEEQAAKTPDKTAVVACDRMLTYQELNEQANRIAHGLIAHGVKCGDIVAFALPRRSYLVAAIIGILKAGAAYLPIDPDYPQDRINYMLEDSKAAYFITELNIHELLTNENATDPMIAMASDSLCYCIYTSGSTGRPKGTLLRHRGIVNLVTNLKMYHNLSNCKRIGFMTTITFDVATQEIFTALLNGFTGVLAAERKVTRTDEIIDGILDNKIDVIYATPTYLDALTDSTAKAERLLSAVKVICLAGEKFYLNRHILSLKDQYLVIFENQYGPVELHVIATATTLENDDFISIGKPIKNNQAYIVDKYMRSVPIGVIGELCIAGDGVGAGYLNRPELTAERFIDNPFGKGKLYKTGDLAYWREDGNIVYVGRNDFQVKIRGLRIELGEIENALQEVEGISQAVVVVRKDESGRQFICAFYSGRETDGKTFRTAIGQKLPKYMLPHIFTRLDTMPLTSSGKANRKALPDVNLSMVSSAVEYIAPVGEMEKRLASLMEQTLGYSPIGRNDDFFDLGGDSLKAIEFLSKAHGEEIYFDLQNVFDYPTVETLCGYLQNGPEKGNSFAPEQFTKYESVLEQNVWDEKFIPERHKLGTVFLTGGTGFLGSHILDTLMKHGTQKIYCLVRGGKERLAQRLQYYFGKQYADEIGKTIIPIVGDLESETPGNDWPEQVDYVIHAAASVKHYGTWQYFKQANVDATAHVLTYAQKIHAKLVYVSTVSVSGNSMADQFDGYVSEDEKHFYESSLYIGQSLDNVYVRSKFEAETLVLDAMCQGFHANIVRMGNLTNRVSDLKFQPNYDENAFLKRVKAILDLGCLPEYPASAYAEFTPVDAAAEAVVKIMEHMNDRYTVFHVNSNRNLYYGRMLKYLTQAGRPLAVLSSVEFARRVRATLRSSQKYIFQALSNHLSQDDMLQFDSNIHIENSFTVRYLRSVGFEWPEIDYAYIRGYLRYFEKLSYIGGSLHDAE